MATWDGSYQEDLNYLVYADRNATDAAARNWQYFAGNTAYVRGIPTGSYYSGTGSDRHIYEQSGSTTQAFYQIGAQHPSNMVPLENNAYQEHVLPNTSTDSMRASNNVTLTSRNAQPPFSHGGYKSRSKGNRTADKHAPPSPAIDVVQSTVVENSKLHPMANEFVPRICAKFRKDSRFRKYNNGNATGNGFNAYPQEFRPKLVDKSSSDNRYKSDRRYDNRRDGNYRQKKPQDMQAQQAPRSGYRDTQRTYNTRNYNKFQNDRYYNRKRQSGAEQNTAEEAHTSTIEATDSATSNSQENKVVFERNQEDNSFLDTKIGRNREETHGNNDSENMSLKIVAQQNRSKRFVNAFHYHRHNSDDMQSESGGRRKTTATAAKYVQRRNNEMTSYKENKEKKMENWRARTESNETTQALQGKNPKKKYDIGIGTVHQRDHIVI